jgi:hypothetical protein
MNRVAAPSWPVQFGRHDTGVGLNPARRPVNRKRAAREQTAGASRCRRTSSAKTSSTPQTRVLAVHVVVPSRSWVKTSRSSSNSCRHDYPKASATSLSLVFLGVFSPAVKSLVHSRLRKRVSTKAKETASRMAQHHTGLLETSVAAVTALSHHYRRHFVPEPSCKPIDKPMRPTNSRER